MIFNYIRVSTVDQNTDRQLVDVPYDRLYEEKVSGKDQNRPQLQAMLGNLREGDLVNVHEMSRLGRNTRDLLEIVDRVLALGASIRFHKENLFFDGSKKKDPYQELMLTMMSGFATFERNLILERQREGIAIAKTQGKYQGKQSRFTKDQVEEIRKQFNDPLTNKAALAKSLNITRAYLYKLMKES